MQPLKSSPLSATYMRRWTASSLVQMMACRLFGAKPLSKPIMILINGTPRNKPQWKNNIETNQFSLAAWHIELSSVILSPFYPPGAWVNAGIGRGLWVVAASGLALTVSLPREVGPAAAESGVPHSACTVCTSNLRHMHPNQGTPQRRRS